MPPSEPSEAAALTRPSSIRRNKLRLYLIFYRGGPGNAQFHPVLAMAPKKPDPHKLQTWRFHLKCVMRGGMPYWCFEGSQVLNYDQRMVAAVLISKLDPGTTGIGLSGLLKEVPVPKETEESTAKQWVCNAIKLMIERDIMPTLPLLPQAIHDRGSSFADRIANVEDATVPTCDFTGIKIKSEIYRA
ncbi:hypothetical protein NEOLEDRAFT_1131859 [Neolentinus lepideus HHB14362 ss-1]|uniref:Uncharacterized protein n=1 Tax=Neolentinus lepideus HHB14362 ss-1 TaxID=1314782 RepID=A0A165TKQ6_9AGAM|nr:hypothetical protein NEOLEDRAFT_1131859 [Neolentinus lepideus HHB14362 ss-1]